MPELNITEPVRLWGFDEQIQPPVRSLLFGEMVRRAFHRLEQYQSDLYHDALWLERFVTGPTTFWWLVRDYGTHMSSDLGYFAHIFAAHGSAGDFYRVDVRNDRGLWFADFTLLHVAPSAVADIPMPEPVAA